MFEEFFSSHPNLKTYALPLGLGAIGIILVGYGLFFSSTTTPKQDAITFDQPEHITKQPAQRATITIDVEGAVQKPGVYQLQHDARIQDALLAAGGLSQNADREAIAKLINLAQPVTDGTKVYFPPAGESAVLGSSQASSMININTASSQDLDSLPGVGTVTAGKIIANRPYASLDDLVSKKIVSKSVFEKIKDQISLY